ncbi:unnamed protein product [Meganyctiphanes norvegica]|uniref:Protein-lysine N-methyltransferase SMYD4 n=1 Tax=Meganyctiphanes norvegica TaxID=48144 RepID=A0AAV2R9L1_MEGNR
MATQKFEYMCTAIMKQLQSSGKLNELGKEFSGSENADEMFRYVYKLDEIHKTITLLTKISPSGKSEEEAENLLVEGNNFFANKCYGLALDVFNMCILTAPHPCCKYGTNGNRKDLNDSRQSFKILAYGYAQRSALLFELKEYKRCIADINQALELESVKPILCELIKRKAKCYIALKKNREAKESLNVLLNSMSPENNNSENLDEIENLLQQCNITDQVVSIETSHDVHRNFDTESDTEDWVLFQYKTPTPPKLKNNNPVIPSFSDALKVQYSLVRGRYIVASRDISPGDVVAMEKGYVCIPNITWANLRSRCTLCLMRCHNPIPCPTCARVAFCSEKCREEGMKKFHSVECVMLPTLIDIGIDKNALQTYRLVIRETFRKLKSYVPILRKEEDEKPRHMHGFNQEGIYDTGDYRAIYHLESNIPSRTVLDLFHKSTKALLITNMLYQTKKFFVNESGKEFMPSHEDLILTGSVVLNHLLNLPQNTFAITEFQANLLDYKNEAKQQNIAGGCYSALSLFNHSCAASTTRANYGDILVLYAKRFIPAGTEVSTSYGYSYHVDEKEERQESLLKDYKFICACKACTEDWPLLDVLPDANLRPVETFIKYPDDCKAFKNLDYSNNDIMEGKLEEMLAKYHGVFKNEKM